LRRLASHCASLVVGESKCSGSNLYGKTQQNRFSPILPANIRPKSTSKHQHFFLLTTKCLN